MYTSIQTEDYLEHTKGPTGKAYTSSCQLTQCGSKAPAGRVWAGVLATPVYCGEAVQQVVSRNADIGESHCTVVYSLQANLQQSREAAWLLLLMSMNEMDCDGCTASEPVSEVLSLHSQSDSVCRHAQTARRLIKKPEATQLTQKCG